MFRQLNCAQKHFIGSCSINCVDEFVVHAFIFSDFAISLCDRLVQ